MSKLKLALLDLYNGIPNQGMRCIREIVAGFSDTIELTEYEVRGRGELPGLDFDICISSGGPGDPREEGAWNDAWGDWLRAVIEHNKRANRKKYVFFICHSFQMAVHHTGLGEVGPRRSISFGTFPVHPTEDGSDDRVFGDLPDPFTAADFRRFQVTQPDQEQMDRFGASVLAIEKDRPYVDLERAVMGIRWTPEIVGVQFHPEADPDGMLEHFSRPEIKTEVIAEHGRDKWIQMMADLSDETKIKRTHDTILPGFLRRCVRALAPIPATASPH